MLIDDSENSDSIKNVSYLIPIGMFLYLIIVNLKSVTQEALFELGLYCHLDHFLNYWLSHFGVLLLFCFVSYFFIRRIWKRILTGEFNCTRLFVSLMIISVLSIVAAIFGSYLLQKFVEIRQEMGINFTGDYIDFVAKAAPFVWVIEYVLLIIVITFAVRTPAKFVSS